MLTIELYGLAEHPKTQLLKVSLLDALVELPLAFSFVQISAIDAFLEQELPEVPCLKVNGKLIPVENTHTPAELSEVLRELAARNVADDQASTAVMRISSESPSGSAHPDEAPKPEKKTKPDFLSPEKKRRPPRPSISSDGTTPKSDTSPPIRPWLAG